MIKIIPYNEKYLASMCDLIQRTFVRYNKTDLTKQGRIYYKDFYNIHKNKERLIKSNKVNHISYLAIDGKKIVGVVRGRQDYCANLFVDGDYHGKGIGTKLMSIYESKCKKLGQKIVKLRSTQFAVPFYQSIGYKKTTWLRSYQGLAVIQPMKKALS